MIDNKFPIFLSKTIGVFGIITDFSVAFKVRMHRFSRSKTPKIQMTI
jgi:hypothetical protein